MNKRNLYLILTGLVILSILLALLWHRNQRTGFKEGEQPTVRLEPVDPIYFKSFVDCNMAEAWIQDTFRIFPGKYGEDPVWGNSRELRFADGENILQAFQRKEEEFKEPALPPNAAPGSPGLHGAVWFETVYQDPKDPSGKTLYAVYHNENYPETLPYDSATGKGYINENWPEGIRGPESPAAVCRIGIMKSVNGGHSWEDKGIFIEDLQPRMILHPINTSKTFAGGVGDPSAVANGDWLYLFYGEYGYAGVFDPNKYMLLTEYNGQCISIARIRLSDLDHPEGKARRWDGLGFNAPYDSVGAPIHNLQVSIAVDGGPASSPQGGFHWGPSVSWNTYLNAWVMLMAKSVGPIWKGSSIYVSFNPHKDLGEGGNSQDWTKPILLLDKPGHVLWYPSIQPIGDPTDKENKSTCLKSGEKGRLYFKDMTQDTAVYVSEYLIHFSKK